MAAAAATTEPEYAPNGALLIPVVKGKVREDMAVPLRITEPDMWNMKRCWVLTPKAHAYLDAHPEPALSVV